MNNENQEFFKEQQDKLYYERALNAVKEFANDAIGNYPASFSWQEAIVALSKVLLKHIESYHHTERCGGIEND